MIAKIRELISSGVLTETRSENLGPVSYDLTTRAFHTRERQSLEKVTLSPGDSTYVSTVEVIKLPENIAARVLLRNSRIRQGLSLDAPLYFPGHHTRVFFRVTNMSSDQITLSTSDGIAQLVLKQLKVTLSTLTKVASPTNSTTGVWVDTKTFMQMKLR